MTAFSVARLSDVIVLLSACASVMPVLSSLPALRVTVSLWPPSWDKMQVTCILPSSCWSMSKLCDSPCFAKAAPINGCELANGVIGVFGSMA